MTEARMKQTHETYLKAMRDECDDFTPKAPRPRKIYYDFKFRAGDTVVCVRDDTSLDLVKGHRFRVEKSYFAVSYQTGKEAEFLDITPLCTGSRLCQGSVGWLADRFELEEPEVEISFQIEKTTIEPRHPVLVPATYVVDVSDKLNEPREFGPFRNSLDARAYIKMARFPFFLRNDVSVLFCDTEEKRKFALGLELTGGNIFIEEADHDDAAEYVDAYLSECGGDSFDVADNSYGSEYDPGYDPQT